MFRILPVFGLSLLLTALTCHSAWAQTLEPQPLESVPYAVDAGGTASFEQGTPTCYGTSSCCTSCCNSCCGCGCGWHGHVQMPPHYAYYPAMHGYYYFRPYNGSMLRPQQMTAVGWGCDSRAPYDNQIFQQVYAEAEAKLK